MALPNFLRTFLQRSIIAGTGLSGGGPLSRDVTLAAKLTDSVASAASDTAASAKAVKAAYDRGSAGIAAAAAAQAAADGKAPGGFGLGTLLSSTPASIAADLNAVKLTGWYAVRPQTLNKPGEVDYAVCTVVAHDNNEIHQTLFSRYGVYHRYISISGAVYRAWVKLFNADYKAVHAMGLGDKGFVDAHVAATPIWLLGLHSDGKLRPFYKDDLMTSRADSAKSISGIIVLYPNAWSVTAPSGGRYAWVGVNEEYLVNVGGPVAGGTTFGYGSKCIRIMFIPAA